jgi:hypothetical protein
MLRVVHFEHRADNRERTIALSGPVGHRLSTAPRATRTRWPMTA